MNSEEKLAYIAEKMSKYSLSGIGNLKEQDGELILDDKQIIKWNHKNPKLLEILEDSEMELVMSCWLEKHTAKEFWSGRQTKEMELEITDDDARLRGDYYIPVDYLGKNWDEEMMNLYEKSGYEQDVKKIRLSMAFDKTKEADLFADLSDVNQKSERDRYLLQEEIADYLKSEVLKIIEAANKI